MAQYSELREDVACPYCEKTITSTVCFQWGATPSVYLIGQKIKWLRDSQGNIKPPFTIYGNRDEWNSGEPEYENLFVLDSNYFAPENSPKCSGCNREIDGISIEIKNNAIASVKALKKGELKAIFGIEDSQIDIIIFENNKFCPRYDLYDHPIKVITKGGN